MISSIDKGVTPPVGAEKWARLEAFLESLPPGSAARLFETIEQGAASGDTRLPAPQMLETLRARLISRHAIFPGRPMTAERIFFAPFEDFLVTSRRGSKRRARIARSSLAPIWRLLSCDPACAEAGRAARALAAALAAGNNGEAEETALFDAAREGARRIMLHAENDRAYRAGLVSRLAGKKGDAFGAAALRDLAEINFLLPVVHYLKEVQSAFARPLAGLTRADLEKLAGIYKRAVADDPDAALYIPLCLAGRLSAPAEALRITYFFNTEFAGDQAREDAGLVANALFDDIESEARHLELDASDAVDFDSAMLRFSEFASTTQNAIDEARKEGDAVRVNRTEASRDIAAAALSLYSESAIGAIRAAEPLIHAGGSGALTGLRPDIREAANASNAERAAAAARFLVNANDIAGRLGRSSAINSLKDEAVVETRHYADDLVSEIRAALGEERRRARHAFGATMTIAAALLPASEVALFKERAAAAGVCA
ncbi:MAG: hypothetical protein R3C60_06245 [Parvularculaceae bacterium]